MSDTEKPRKSTMNGIDRVRIKGDKPWNITITNADTGDLITCVTRVEYATDVTTQEHYVKLFLDTCDVDIDVIAPAKVVEEKR